MAVVKMNKFTLLAFESQKEKLLENLQALQGVQFINLQDENEVENNEELKELNKDNVDSKITEYKENLSKVKFALSFLKDYIPQKKGLKDMLEDKRDISYSELNDIVKESNWHDLYSVLKGKEERLNHLSNEKTKYENEIHNLSLWKNFDAPFKYLKDLKMASYFIGSLPKQHEETIAEEFKKEVENGHFEILNRDNQDVYVFALVNKDDEEKTSEVFKRYGYSALALTYDDEPKKVIEDFEGKIVENIREKEIIEQEIKGFEDKIEKLEVVYEYYNNIITRESASNNFLKTEKIVTICGWCPTQTNNELEKVVNEAVGKESYLTFEKVKDDEVEKVPIKLKNNGFASAFEGVLEMYSLPTYKEVDPTPIFSIFYAIFFGMMLSDAGYGLVMVLGSLFALSKTKDIEKRKTFKMFLFAGISTVVWGAIYGGWFGNLFPEYLKIKIPFIMKPADNVVELMVISCAFGVVHIFIGLAIKGYSSIKNGCIKDAIYDVLTWYVTIIGTILWILGISAGKWLFIVGIVGLLLTQGRTAPSIGGKIAGGLYGVYGLTGYFGDIVSYLRLLALGLTTGFIADSMNLMLKLIGGNIILKFTLVPVLFIIFHLFNLALNAVGTYVHTARLQYLEFFNKFYEGGGKKFTPYKYSDVYVKINK